MNAEQVIDYIGNEVRSLHEGNAIRYRLSADDLASMRRDDNRRTPEAARNYLSAEVRHSSILTGSASVIGSRSTTRRLLGQLRWRGDAAPAWLVARYW